ncbi:uncharacterized protein [Anoplolepis gracilipes]|uniref:uncharacterized protein n=1 Tax=Anoplolepis gracilipes TaxID=354296 RepID=UPI003B9FC4BD
MEVELEFQDNNIEDVGQDDVCDRETLADTSPAILVNIIDDVIEKSAIQNNTDSEDKQFGTSKSTSLKCICAGASRLTTSRLTTAIYIDRCLGSSATINQSESLILNWPIGNVVNRLSPICADTFQSFDFVNIIKYVNKKCYRWFTYT